MIARPAVGRQDGAVLWLQERQLVSEGAVRQAEAARAADPGRPELMDHLIASGAVGREEAHRAIAALFRGATVCDLSAYAPQADAEDLLPSETARRLGALPLARAAGAVMEVAVCDPFDLATLAELQDWFGGTLQPQLVLADAHAVYARISAMAARDSEPEPEALDVVDLTERAATEAGPRSTGTSAMDQQVRDSAVSQLTDRILQDAIRLGASDVHIEFFPGFGWVRMRIDGVLREWRKLPAGLEQDLVGHVKARAKGMDSANRLTPQDGRLTMSTSRRGGSNRSVEFRVSTIPTVNGEKAVLRVVDRGVQSLALEELGMTDDALATLRRAMRQNGGMILVTGPTGSGKTRTLYSIISELASPEVNIITLEEPVEQRLAMVTQVSIRPTDDPRTTVEFRTILRFLLRQDPNVIMVGEIRDAETATTATRLAMTGHLLLATLHTNDAPSTVLRLVDMGVEPYNVAGTVRLVLAQRLVRTICERCKEPCEPDPRLVAASGMDARRITGIRFMHGRGCEACNGTGYYGRTGVFEVLEVDETIRRLIAQGRSDKEIASAGLANHMQPLRQAGWRLIREGVTTLEEVLKET
jgi:type IV pilus assembly protein PilB